MKCEKHNRTFGSRAQKGVQQQQVKDIHGYLCILLTLKTYKSLKHHVICSQKHGSLTGRHAPVRFVFLSDLHRGFLETHFEVERKGTERKYSLCCAFEFL